MKSYRKNQQNVISNFCLPNKSQIKKLFNGQNVKQQEIMKAHQQEGTIRNKGTNNTQNAKRTADISKAQLTFSLIYSTEERPPPLKSSHNEHHNI